MGLDDGCGSPLGKTAGIGRVFKSWEFRSFIRAFSRLVVGRSQILSVVPLEGNEEHLET